MYRALPIIFLVFFTVCVGPSYHCLCAPQDLPTPSTPATSAPSETMSPKEENPDFFSIMAINAEERRKTVETGKNLEPLSLKEAVSRLRATIDGLMKGDFSTAPEEMQSFLSAEKAKMKAILEKTRAQVQSVLSTPRGASADPDTLFAIYLSRNMIESSLKKDAKEALDPNIAWTAVRFQQTLEAQMNQKPEFIP